MKESFIQMLIYYNGENNKYFLVRVLNHVIIRTLGNDIKTCCSFHKLKDES